MKKPNKKPNESQDDDFAALMAMLGMAEEPEGTHKHKCQTCGNVWEHENACVNNKPAHTCRECGSEQWWKYDGRERGTFIGCLAAVR